MTQQNQPEFSVFSTNSGKCRKAIHLDLTGTEPSNPPSQANLNMMYLGVHARDAVVEAMKRDGWRIKDLKQEHSMPLGHGNFINCRPHFVASHDEITGGETVAVRSVTASSRRYKVWNDSGPIRSHPEAYNDLAVCTMALGQADIINMDEAQMFVIFNRENGDMSIDPIESEDLVRRYNGLKARLNEMADILTKGETPQAEYHRDSNECRTCQFLDLCHGSKPKRRPQGPITQEEIETVFESYAEATDVLSTTKPFESQQRKGRDTIKKYLQEQETPSITITAGGSRWTAEIKQGEPKLVVDEEKLKEILNSEQLTKVYVEQTSERISIQRLG